MVKYELEDRVLKFAIDCRQFVKRIPKSIANIEDGKQLIKSSGSVGANYIEANEKLGPKDLLFRLKISRKEAKESKYWLKIIEGANEFDNALKKDNRILIDEADQLRKILSAILNKVSQ